MRQRKTSFLYFDLSHIFNMIFLSNYDYINVDQVYFMPLVLCRHLVEYNSIILYFKSVINNYFDKTSRMFTSHLVDHCPSWVARLFCYHIRWTYCPCSKLHIPTYGIQTFQILVNWWTFKNYKLSLPFGSLYKWLFDFGLEKTL